MSEHHILSFDATWVGSISVHCSCSDEPIITVTASRVLAEDVLIEMQKHLERARLKEKAREVIHGR